MTLQYTDAYNGLKTVFDPGQAEIAIPGSDSLIRNTTFVSDMQSGCFSNPADLDFGENYAFSYPVFVPSDRRSKKMILLLHGLNERSWQKYLSWAFVLSQLTGAYVVLFPISFHINRSPVAWSDPRKMMPFVNDRRIRTTANEKSSFANIALSNRLSEDPRRFFNSGYQTVCDIEKLLGSVRTGQHPIIPGGSTVDIFAYSIGAFLAQILIMGNPGELLTDSRLFMFCGGSVFSNMNGTSRLIMDSLAYRKVYNYYMKDFEGEISGQNKWIDFFRFSQVGMAFRSMIDLGRFRKFREDVLMKLKDRTCSIALNNDSVIPSHGIIETLKGKSEKRSMPVEVWDFPFEYSHENPFPVFETPASQQVDLHFSRLMSKASAFLC